jgi:hypothetical protein
MVTKEQAQALTYRTELYHKTLKDSRKAPLRARVNGQCKTWKTRPDEWQLPMKHGLRTCFYITQSNAHEWSIEP